MNVPDIQSVLTFLRTQYGRRQFQPHHDPLSELVLTILSQNTSDTNSRPAFEALRNAFATYEDILHAPVEQIELQIKRAGLGKIKARRIQDVLNEILQRRGSLELEFLQDMPLAEAREWLINLPGVGYKTANCVLLFALGRPALPVDTHIFRVAKRLGLIPAEASILDAHQRLGTAVPPVDIYEFHLLVIEHGRRICIARRPRCPECSLVSLCPSHDVAQPCKIGKHQG